MDIYRGTFAIVNLNAIANNVRHIRKLMKPETRLLIAVKANGYGHGAVEVARTVLDCGATDLGVATLEEALELRWAGITAPILIFGSISPQSARIAAANDVTITLTEDWSARSLPAFDKPLRVHIKVDTGMSRLGFLETDDILRVVSWLHSRRDIVVTGIYTHLACADDVNSSFADDQLHRLNQVVSALESAGLAPPLVHAANSAGILRNEAFHLGMVRAGISTYGYKPDVAFPTPILLEPALNLYAFITRVARVPKGTRIGYGGTYTTKRDTVVATVPVGYADGYPRWLSNRGEVYVRGSKVPVIGRICMDQFMIDVTDVQPSSHAEGIHDRDAADEVGVAVGDCVTLYGHPAPGCWTAAALESFSPDERAEWLQKTFMQEQSTPIVISLDDLANVGHTISYELMCALSQRVPRIYL